MMKILTEEVHILDEEILTVAAFYDITVRTAYSLPVMEAEFGTDIAEMVQTLQRKENEICIRIHMAVQGMIAGIREKNQSIGMRKPGNFGKKSIGRVFSVSR